VSGIKLPLVVSLAGHAACLALLAQVFAAAPPFLPTPAVKGGIEVVFEPALPKENATSVPVEPPPAPAETASALVEPKAEASPPAPEPPEVAAETPPPAPSPPPEPTGPVAASEPAPPPPPPQKHAAKKPPKPAPRHQEAAQPSQAVLPNLLAQFPVPPAPAAPPRTAMAAPPVPAPQPSPETASKYAIALSAWLERHKRYPEAARDRGEEGSAVLRFSLDRSGRVIDYAITSSAGYTDLDQSIAEMIRNANFPPFPAEIPEQRREFWVTIRFSLR
jgi:protein TonB